MLEKHNCMKKKCQGLFMQKNNKTNIITFPTYLETVRNIFDLLKLYAQSNFLSHDQHNKIQDQEVRVLNLKKKKCHFFLKFGIHLTLQMADQ